MCALLMSRSDTDGKILHVSHKVVVSGAFSLHSSPINQQGLLLTTARSS